MTIDPDAPNHVPWTVPNIYLLSRFKWLENALAAVLHYNSHTKWLQGLTRTRASVKLSKEAWAAVIARCKEAIRRFRKDLNETWRKIDEATESIAVTHHKSVCRIENNLHMGQALLRSKRSRLNVWNAFCWKKNKTDTNRDKGAGKDTLHKLICDHRNEYHKLTSDEKNELSNEYKEYKETKAVGLRISTKSRVNDVTHTLKSVEKQLDNLKSRTGAESILFTTRGSTDLPLHGIAFTMPGVEDFMGTAMCIDAQHFIGKMEGFAVQGIKGAAKNHQQRVSAVCGEICEIMQVGLRGITGDDKGKMQWKNYWRNCHIPNSHAPSYTIPVSSRTFLPHSDPSI
ncbi:hypothetical protein BV22DRAFT_1131496 [Leucogyrophana mollusca]|uniref:Uncharacterized protein n=1 Tax=Leucogyrophana mollusca TaxID=85980 RepID=A0ACB8BBQ8_9AGAM|nr:hypothetical protein BV22DRAFT_1131496 [Leucogyrophana mollusca]